MLHAASTGAEMSMLHCHYLDKMVLIGPLLVAMLFPVQTLNQNCKNESRKLFLKGKLNLDFSEKRHMTSVGMFSGPLKIKVL